MVAIWNIVSLTTIFIGPATHGNELNCADPVQLLIA